MQICKTVYVRKRKLKNGTYSLFLDFYPGYRDPKTKKLIRRQVMDMYIFQNPKNKYERDFNEQILQKAEAVRCKVYIDILNDKYDFFTREMLQESFVDYLKELSERDSNACKWNSTYKLFVKFSEGKCTFGELDLDMCHRFQKYLQTAKALTKDIPLSHNSYSAFWTCFKNALKTAFKERKIKENIAELLDNVPWQQTSRESLSLDELRLIYNSECKNDDMRRAILFACQTGIRISDVLSMRWDNFRTFADGGWYVHFKCHKTKRITDVPVSDELYEVMGTPGTGRLFPHFKRSDAQKPMKDWLKSIGIKKHITFHCFRHTYASLLVELGTDIYTVQHMLEHKNVSTTQIYACHADPKMREASKRITLKDVKKENGENQQECNDTENNVNSSENKD